MAFSDAYRKQVALLVRILPLIAPEDCFALKGGTAINLFLRDMPRLSVDIDLTYLPIRSRRESLAEINSALGRIADRIAALPGNVRITKVPLPEDGTTTKLFVNSSDAQVKIEVTPVLRGCVYEPEIRPVSEKVENLFGFAEAKVVSFADLYGGKLVAALDRQHPRDLFDVRDLFANEGISDELRIAFIVYLISHRRPMHEVLACRPKDISPEFVHGFEGMTERPVTLEDLIATREALVSTIVGDMPAPHRDFLVSFEKGEPKWDLLKAGIEKLPAVQWRQQNLDKLTENARNKLVGELVSVLKRQAGGTHK